MARIAYYRTSSTEGQTTESQRSALGGPFDREFVDEGISGATPAADRPGFAALLQYIREGDTLHVYAVDRLGRDAIDVQQTVRKLLDKGVSVEVRGLGTIARGVGELILAVLAQVADMERQRIRERTEAGRQAARALLAQGKPTQNGKTSLGRPQRADPAAVREWRELANASLSQTAAHWGLSLATVKRYCARA